MKPSPYAFFIIWFWNDQRSLAIIIIYNNWESSLVSLFIAIIYLSGDYKLLMWNFGLFYKMLINQPYKHFQYRTTIRVTTTMNFSFFKKNDLASYFMWWWCRFQYAWPVAHTHKIYLQSKFMWLYKMFVVSPHDNHWLFNENLFCIFKWTQNNIV